MPPLITTPEERVDLLAGSGIDELYLGAFRRRIWPSSTRAVFLSEIVARSARARAARRRRELSLRAGRTGDAALAREVMREPGGDGSDAVPPSSTGERAHLEHARSRRDRARRHGDGRPSLVRTVRVARPGRAGFRPGHDLGFPTANLDLPLGQDAAQGRRLHGVLAATTAATIAALVSIGSNPTFGPGAKTVEAWLQDFRKTIYGEEFSLRDLAFVRDQRTFGSAEELVDQMHHDATHVQFPAFTLS